MRYSRTILFITAVSSLLGGLGACKKKLPPQAGASPGEASLSWDGRNYIPEEGASLTLWFDNEEVSEAVVEEWSRVYPEIPLDYEVVGTVDARLKMTLDGPAGIGADVFVQPHDGIFSSYQDGILLPMGEYTRRISESFNAQAAGAAFIDGSQYAIPWTLENIALFWNKELYPGEPPRTWDEIVEFAGEYNDPVNNKWAIRWEVNNAYINYFFLTAYGFRLFGEQSVDADNPGWDSPAVLEGLTYFQSLREIFDVGADDTTGEYTVVEFAKGTVPLMITGPWSIQDYKEAGIDFGVTTLPLLPGERRPYPFSGAQLINVSSYTPYPNAARRLAMFMTEDAVLERMYNLNGKLPARNDAVELDYIRNDPYQRGILEQAPFSYPMPTIPEMAFAWEPQRILFYYTWNGDLTPREAIQKALEDYEAQRSAADQ